jgi:23S rRNA (cytosine1962-C5)-methyltransferase
MFPPDQYQLLDFGDGRRLEQFASIRLDRPCPTAERTPRGNLRAWHDVDGRYERLDDEQGRWQLLRELPERWTVSAGSIRLELKRTEFGHLGVFPEHAATWDWIAGRVAAAGRPVRVLNLFAYTGGSTLAAAAAGAEVTHVDSARNIVAWARRNAELSGLSAAPIHWIAEDARKFVRRELNRGNRYDAVLLDPPSYGHGSRGEVWRLSKHLPGLLAACAELTAESREFLLLTCHTPGYGAERLGRMLAEAMDDDVPGRVSTGQLTLRAVDGRELPHGGVARWEKRERT